MLIYAAIGAFGLVFLLVMLFVGEVFGGDHDLHGVEVHAEHGDSGHEGGPSVFSARIMAAFLTAFGAGGVVARYYGLSHPAASGAGTTAGVVLAGLVYQFAKLLYSQQATSGTVMSALVGQIAEVTIGIPAGGAGQVTLAYGGERSTHIARSADGAPIPHGAEVLITALRGDSIIVERRAPAAPPGGSS